MMRTQASIESKNAYGRSFMPVASGLVQRKCACGSHAAAGGECDECAKKKSMLQRKLSIGASNDPLEQEADRVAGQVMAMSFNTQARTVLPRIQRVTGQSSEDSSTAPPSVDRVLASSGRRLEPVLQQDMESRFGYDFSQVRVHTGSAAEQSARDVNAHAYTVGNNVVFGAGQFIPGSNEGKRLLAHELAHTIQQSHFGERSLIQRNCSSHPDEAYYANARNYCRDTGFTGMFHSGRTCYREVPRRSSYFECPPGDQVCFNENGACEDSYDEASPVESRDSDGTCNLHHLCTWTMHTGEDVVPGLLEQATDPLARGLGELEREIYRLYGAPYF